jgi:hypothetical protein
MHDVFISYNSSDERLARFVHQHLVAEGVSAFLASVSLKPGDKWTPEVFTNLNAAKWVIFLASRKACASPYVLQELGAALAAQKKLVPVIWDIQPNELPGWVNQHQALNLAGRTLEDLRTEIAKVARRIKQDRTSGLLAVGLLIAGLAAFSK